MSVLALNLLQKRIKTQSQAVLVTKIEGVNCDTFDFIS